MINDFILRPVLKDGIIVVPVIYKSPKIVNIESQHINYKRKYNGEIIKEALSLYHESYKTIEDALMIIKQFSKTNKLNIRSGEIQNPNKYLESLLEESILPYEEDYICSVCNEKTTDITECNHGLCISCREKILKMNIYNCPICRTEGINFYKSIINYYPNEDTNIVNMAYLNTLDINYYKEINNESILIQSD